MTFFEVFEMQDYVLFWVSFFFAISFIFFGLEQLYKSYLGIILGLCVFSMINLSLWTLQESDLGVNGVRDFFYNHREFFSIYSILFIPFLAFALPFNESITFRIGKRKSVKYIASFFFWFFYISFFFSIFLSIIHNRFFFSIEPMLIAKIETSFVVQSIVNFFQPSVLFQFLSGKDYIVSFVMTLYIFYKMTIWGIVDAILLFLVNILKKILENQKNTSTNSHEAFEDEDEENYDISHWHHAHH